VKREAYKNLAFNTTVHGRKHAFDILGMHAFPLLGAKLHMNCIIIEECCGRDKSKMVVVRLRIGGDFTISGEISLRRATMTIKVFRFPL
jgi:hypothetical protein